ncbi:MAG: hypothetical protein JO153_20190, partial [Solirubrobacterales bacterium]|nr:hypothetical protein [Solirubrobacterales bacterium]
MAETDGAGSVGAYYVRAGGQLLALRRGATSSFYLADGLGSVRELVDATATITDAKVYSAYGETVATTGTTTQSYG